MAFNCSPPWTTQYNDIWITCYDSTQRDENLPKALRITRHFSPFFRAKTSMFRTARSQCLRAVLSRTRAPASSFSSTASASSSQPNAPLDLDPSFKTLLRDVDLSLARHKADKAARYGNSGPAPLPHRELETLPLEQDSEEYPLATIDTQVEEEYWDPRAARKSPAATFGSHGIGQVTIPFELQDSITRLIEGKECTSRGTLIADACIL